MRNRIDLFGIAWGALLAATVFTWGCPGDSVSKPALEIPRGHVQILEINVDGAAFRVGPFVGYYFKPEDPADPGRLKFVCFNERRFYTLDLPENAKLFEGEALFATLPAPEIPRLEPGERMRPVYFEDAPESWLGSRPEPRDEFVHFHSCYNANGPVRHGYWLRHVGAAEFVYDMGGRVGPDSPLYHRVEVGVDKKFARIVEFDGGPGKTGG